MTNFKRNFIVAVSVAMLTVAPALAGAERPAADYASQAWVQ